jgi:transcriptional regulator with XRE-family HTH domain
MSKTKRTSTTQARRQDLGRKLRMLRKEKGLTGQALARRLGVSQATVSKVETGAQMVDIGFLLKFATLLKLSRSEAGQLVSDARLLSPRTGAVEFAEVIPFDYLRRDEAGKRQRSAAKIENAASQIREFSPSLVPGLLQTADYARHAIRVSGITRANEIERGVKARLARQASLKKKKSFIFVLAENALRAQTGPVSVMRKQLRQLRKISARRNVTIGLIPWHVRLPVWLPPNFALFDDRLAYVELPHGELSMTAESDVRIYLGLFEELQKAAVYGDAFHGSLDRLEADIARLAEFQVGPSPTLS